MTGLMAMGHYPSVNCSISDVGIIITIVTLFTLCDSALSLLLYGQPAFHFL